MVAEIPILLIYRFQKLGVNKINTVKISKRPTIIKKDIYHLAKAGISANDPEGPFAPKPGPTLLIAVTEAPKASITDIPVNVRMPQLKKTINI